MDVSIVVVGDEILSGHVQDANAHFIATRLAEHGHQLRRVLIMADDPVEIAEALVRELSDSELEMIFVCGGLGPTHDDRTMEGIAAALHVPLVRCEPIAQRIERIAERVAQASFQGDPLGMEGLMKMALAPEGAEALICSSGIVPAFSIEARSKRIVVLPGPPRELETTFRETVEPRFLEGRGKEVVREEVEHHFPESALATALIEAERRYPEVKIGSYPLSDRVLIRVAGSKEAVSAASSFVREAIEMLAESEDGKRLLTIMKHHP